MEKKVVHVLAQGRSLCGLPGVPADWPEGHVFVPFLDRAVLTKANCDECVLAAREAVQGSAPEW